MDQTTDVRQLGPVEFALLEFTAATFDGSIAGALADIVDRKVVSILDLLLVRKTAEGDLAVIELKDAGIEITASFDEVEGQVMWLLSDADIQAAATSLAPDSTGLLVVWENTWARDFREAVIRSGGRLVIHDQLDADQVAVAIAETPEA